MLKVKMMQIITFFILDKLYERKLSGYNPTLLAGALSNLQSLSRDCKLEEEKDEVASLLNQRSSLQREVQSCNQTLSAYGNLCDMGFGLKELRLLWCTIHYYVKQKYVYCFIFIIYRYNISINKEVYLHTTYS